MKSNELLLRKDMFKLELSSRVLEIPKDAYMLLI